MKPIRVSTTRALAYVGRRPHRPITFLNLPATDSVELGQGLRYEGLWVEGRWTWSLWLDQVQIRWDPARLGSDAVN